MPINVKEMEKFFSESTGRLDYERIALNLIEITGILKDQLILVEGNLRMGMSKSIQKAQAKAIRDVLEENLL